MSDVIAGYNQGASNFIYASKYIDFDSNFVALVHYFANSIK